MNSSVVGIDLEENEGVATYMALDSDIGGRFEFPMAPDAGG